jgi:hypothetical protein
MGSEIGPFLYFGPHFAAFPLSQTDALPQIISLFLDGIGARDLSKSKVIKKAKNPVVKFI